MIQYPGKYVTIEWTNGLWRGDCVNIGVIIMCPDIKYIDVMLTPNGGHEDQRIATFFEMGSMEPLVRNKESIHFRVDGWRKDYFDNPHLDMVKRREFIFSNMDHNMIKCSVYGSLNYHESRAIVISENPSLDLKRVYDDMVAWPSKV